jgi:PAS domain S-box-containing protein
MSGNIASDDPIHVLYVDNDPASTERAEAYFTHERDDFAFQSATRMSEGLDHLEHERIDCIVSEHELPERTGLEFLERVRESWPDLPFILYTASGDEQLASDAISAGVTDYLVKGTEGQRLADLASCIRDILQVKRSHWETTTWLRAVIEASPAALIAVDLDDTVQLWNPAAERIFGWTADEVLGGLLPTLPDDREEEHTRFLDRLLEGEYLSGIDSKRRRKDGAIVDVSFSGAPLCNERGEIVGGMGALQDITDLKDRERRLERQNERLEEFASVVSHDLRSPLNAAGLQLTLAQQECDSDHLEAVGRAHDRMNDLIEDVLTLAREGQTVTEVTEVPLDSLFESCWEHLQTGPATKVVDTDQTVLADRPRLQRLLENLIRNALEHGAEDATVRLGELPDGFYIEDDGKGIPEERREKIFEAGYSESDRGTGFGLSICRQIAEAHQWEIETAESQTGGARFEITGVDRAD